MMESSRRTRSSLSTRLAELVDALVGIRDEAIVLLLFKTGIRKGELIFLDMDSINWKNQSIILKPPKNRTKRTVFFDEEAAYCLKRRLAV